MNLQERYQEDYILLASLRHYVEQGTMLASVNFWRDSAQNFKELTAIEQRSSILESHPNFKENEFLVSFISSDFPPIEDHIPDNIFELVFPLIETTEGKGTLDLLKDFLIAYAVYIAKSSTEDWKSFIGLSDSISDAEETFISKLKELITY
jgi:hypothetical protein